MCDTAIFVTEVTVGHSYWKLSTFHFFQLIVVPYSILLHRSTRKACGLNLRNNVVIIDEAHNLLETISSIHNVLISGSQVRYFLIFSSIAIYVLLIGQPSSLATVAVPIEILHPPFTEESAAH